MKLIVKKTVIFAIVGLANSSLCPMESGHSQHPRYEPPEKKRTDPPPTHTPGNALHHPNKGNDSDDEGDSACAAFLLVLALLDGK